MPPIRKIIPGRNATRVAGMASTDADPVLFVLRDSENRLQLQTYRRCEGGKEKRENREGKREEWNNGNMGRWEVGTLGHPFGALEIALGVHFRGEGVPLDAFGAQSSQKTFRSFTLASF